MKTVKVLPDVLTVPVGTQVKCGKRSYTKAISGRWSVDLTPKLLAEVHRVYVVEGMSLRDTKAALEIPGMPKINMQKVLEDQGWMRSHYGRNDERDTWYSENRGAILKAHREYGVDIRSLGEWSGVPLGVRLMADGVKARRSGRTTTRASALASGWLSREQVASWNYYLLLDENSLSFVEYRKAVATVSFLVLRRFCIRKAHNDHVDHKLSRYFGFYSSESYPVPGKFMNFKRDRVIPIRYMAHPANLRIVSSAVNCKKKHRSLFDPLTLKRIVDKKGGPLMPIDYQSEVRTLMKKLGATQYKGE